LVGILSHHNGMPILINMYRSCLFHLSFHVSVTWLLRPSSSTIMSKMFVIVSSSSPTEALAFSGLDHLFSFLSLPSPRWWCHCGWCVLAVVANIFSFFDFNKPILCATLLKWVVSGSKAALSDSVPYLAILKQSACFDHVDNSYCIGFAFLFWKTY
jgi:hypothetical protein